MEKNTIKQFGAFSRVVFAANDFIFDQWTTNDFYKKFYWIFVIQEEEQT